ncbi:putative methyltransferase DDB_G0268948 [Liolophura sinensis]|uniref:putative methyltransferase DDB_G0268948 n=1 Tax=Liolophura sinensis TaxID=3198878 RepID=UPI0031582D03
MSSAFTCKSRFLLRKLTAVPKSCLFQRFLRVTKSNKYRFSTMAGSDNYAKLFSSEKIAQAYARFRPDYNAAVWDVIMDYCEKGTCHFELAVDVGCGTGQSTLPLSERFKQVIGIDVSEQQIKHAQSNSKASNISYRVGAAEDLSKIQDGSVDLITCAQALHWMDLEKFYPEVTRVSRPGGSLVAYGYGIWCLDVKEAEDICMQFYGETLGPYWGTGRKHVEEKYSQFALPFPGWVRHEDIWQEKEFTVDDFCGYMSSWSAYHKYKEEHPEETELSAVCTKLKKLYSEREDPPGPGVMTVKWPVFLLMGRKPE